MIIAPARANSNAPFETPCEGLLRMSGKWSGGWARQAAPLRGGRAGEIEAGQRGAFAVAAALEGFELVKGLREQPMQVRFIAHDLVQGIVRGKDAPAYRVVDCLRGDALLKRSSESALSVACSHGHVARDLLQVDDSHLSLVASGAAQAPEQLSNTFGEDGLEMAVRRQAGDDAV